MPETPHVTIAHDDALVVDVLAVTCARNSIEVLGIARDYEELLGRYTALRPDVALVADRIDGVRVEEVLDQVVALDTSVIVLSEDPSPDRLAQLLARDISGLLTHDAGPDEVVAAICAVARGEMALNPSLLTLILQQWRRLRTQPVHFGAGRRPVLTPRELDILAAMVDGLAAKAIAARLGVALKTVENHKIRVFEKLGVRSHAQAVSVAMAYGLAPVGTNPQRSDLDVAERP
ncbi:MAG: response regulator transcription factor [Actinomycetota bacterium]|nr:response regulator transcription factor [Actinomycetota bacterium]